MARPPGNPGNAPKPGRTGRTGILLVGLGFLDFRNVESHSESVNTTVNFSTRDIFLILVYLTCHCWLNFHLLPFWVTACVSFFLLLVFANSLLLPCNIHCQVTATTFFLTVLLLLWLLNRQLFSGFKTSWVYILFISLGIIIQPPSLFSSVQSPDQLPNSSSLSSIYKKHFYNYLINKVK